jgi:hypothetical protein
VRVACGVRCSAVVFDDPPLHSERGEAPDCGDFGGSFVGAVGVALVS